MSTRRRVSRLLRGRMGPVTGEGSDPNAGLNACVSDLAGLRRRLDRSSLPEHVELRESIGTLLETFAEASGAFQAGAHWPKAAPELGGVLLEVGRRALDAGDTALAESITDTIINDRPTSQAGWRLRARTLERTGDVAAAIDAHERYLTLVKTDGLGIGRRIEAMRRRDRAAKAFAEALEPVGAGPAEELWNAGLGLVEDGRWAEAKPRLAAALARLVKDEGPSNEVEEAMTAYVSLLSRHERGELRRSRPLLQAYAEVRRMGHQSPGPDPLHGGVRVIDVSGLRNLIDGKTVCLVANSDLIRRGRMGAEIDSYDLVVRFNSFVIEPPATGGRTDVHATIHKHDFNWDKRVGIRLIFGGDQSMWRRSVRKHLVPGAQDHVGDRSLAWPVMNPELIGDTALPGLPTTGFNMLRLLDFLDVSPRIDLIGFDFYTGGAYRVPEAMGLPIAPIHAYDYERKWVMERAREAGEMRIRLR